MINLDSLCLNFCYGHSSVVENIPKRYFVNDKESKDPEVFEQLKFSNEETEVVPTILIVDDDSDVLSSTSDLFQAIGYRVLEAGSGEAALEIISKNDDISFLLSDVLMPGMNGIQLARKVREIYPSLRIVLASGYPLPALRSELGSLDEFPFINKPYSIADIAKKFGN